MPLLTDHPDSDDVFQLNRFVAAQEKVYGQVIKELSDGRKLTHWIWYIFPQIEGLGWSGQSKKYAIKSLAEARAYLGHEVLGNRLRHCTETVNALAGKSALDIFGDIDTLKFKSCMTLFANASASETVFSDALDKYFAGGQDMKTIALLGKLKN